MDTGTARPLRPGLESVAPVGAATRPGAGTASVGRTVLHARAVATGATPRARLRPSGHDVSGGVRTGTMGSDRVRRATFRQMRRRGLVAAAATIGTVFAGVATGHGPPVVAEETDGYRSLPAPVRLADTRPGQSTIDGSFVGTGKLGDGQVLELDVAGRAGIPDDATAVVLNVTVTEPDAFGFITVYPCDQPAPTASALNYAPGQTVPNAVIATIADDGTVCFFALARTHLVVDAAGWFPTGTYQPLASPRRVFDSRPGEPLVPDGTGGAGRLAARSVTAIPIAGRGGVPDDATAVALNVTTTNPQEAGFVTVYPCDAERPLASNLNYLPFATVPNLVISRLSAAGEICVYTWASADVIVDVSGMLPASTFVPLDAPRRVLDTRPGERTADRAFEGEGAQPAGSTLQLDVAGRVGVPAEASAVVLNVTAVAPEAAGFVTVHPRGTDRPNASNVNYAPGDVIANSVVARVGRDGQVCFFALAGQHLVVDVAGWLTGEPPPDSGGDCPTTRARNPNARDAVVARPALHAAIGVDRVAVLACDDGRVNPVEPETVVADANADVAPWFSDVSGGRFRVQFETHPLRHIAVANASECSSAAIAATPAPFTNVMVYDSSDYGGGFGSPGFIYSHLDLNVLRAPPSETRRGFFVGGLAAREIQATVVHEVGHTLHWPHSYTGASGSEYDNPVDVMSGEPTDEFDPELWCEMAGGSYTWCRPQQTLAFNRLAAGWVDGGQVAIHPSGRANYALDRPGGDGVQVVAVPHPAAPLRMLTIEARPAVGYDADLVESGVAVHVVDQGDGVFGVSTSRRQAQAVAVPHAYDHVIEPGERLTVDGVTVEVLAAVGDGFRVVVAGTYAGPPIWVDDFPFGVPV